MDQSQPTQPFLIAFYEGHEKDHRGRLLEDILQWQHRQLEASHDYIQLLFPLPEGSDHNYRAPIVDSVVFTAFRTRKDLQDRLKDSLKRILWFFGFEFHTDSEGNLTVRPAASFHIHIRNWNTAYNHNHLRITRIIRSLRVLGLEVEALAFYGAVLEAGTRVTSTSRVYWARAATRPLNIAPDVSDDAMLVNGGPSFLREL